MRAVVFDAYGQEPRVRSVPEPDCPPGAVVVAVRATGVCRSDWHAWRGHDPVALPHVPGHELAGEVVRVGDGVTRVAVGRPRHRAVRLWLRGVRPLPLRRRAGLSGPVPARLHRSGLVRRAGDGAGRGHQRGAAARRARIRGGGGPRVPVRDRVPCGAGARPDQAGPVAGGVRLRWRRAVRGRSGAGAGCAGRCRRRLRWRLGAGDPARERGGRRRRRPGGSRGAGPRRDRRRSARRHRRDRVAAGCRRVREVFAPRGGTSRSGCCSARTPRPRCRWTVWSPTSWR